MEIPDFLLKTFSLTDAQKEDLPILCERFTTSKLQKFEDLSSIATYGFRGEALASISHIAHLTVITKPKDSDCAWRAHYDGGKLIPAKPGQTPDPKPVAGRNGTQITVEDLFYNIPTRRRAFRSASDEYNKIIDMVGRYAIHCSHVAFSCKKQGDSSMSISVPAAASVVDRVRQIYGGSVANELVGFSTSDDRWGFNAEGQATNANYHIKKTTLLLFINHRCVESSNIKKAIEQTYAAFLPKNGHPFVYLSLQIDPRRVDVNVHPTKREVNFLNEDEIIQAICEHIRSKLAAVDMSRTFLTQTLLPGADWANQQMQQADEDIGTISTNRASSKKTTRPYENNLVRTDTNLRKITSMFTPTGEPSTGDSGAPDTTALDRQYPPEAIEYETNDREATPCRLASVRELRSDVRDEMHHDLTEIFATHTFVGVVDERRRLAAIQGGVKLYLIDYGRACFEYFYQVGLTDFGNFGVIRFSPFLDLRGVLRIAAEYEKDKAFTSSDAAEDFDVDEAVEVVSSQLIERREMLSEYFSFEISPAGELISIPLLIKNYTPSMSKLPQFLLRLGPHVDWTEEKSCFETFLRELASFYVPEMLPVTPGNAEEAAAELIDDEVRTRRRHVRWAAEHVFFPAFKARLVATRSLMKGGVLEIANLKGLYRVFERC